MTYSGTYLVCYNRGGDVDEKVRPAALKGDSDDFVEMVDEEFS